MRHLARKEHLKPEIGGIGEDVSEGEREGIQTESIGTENAGGGENEKEPPRFDEDLGSRLDAQIGGDDAAESQRVPQLVGERRRGDGRLLRRGRSPNNRHRAR